METVRLIPHAHIYQNNNEFSLWDAQLSYMCMNQGQLCLHGPKKRLLYAISVDSFGDYCHANDKDDFNAQFTVIKSLFCELHGCVLGAIIGRGGDHSTTVGFSSDLTKHVNITVRKFKHDTTEGMSLWSFSY